MSEAQVEIKNVQTEAPVEDTPIQPSRAKFDFPSDVEVAETSETSETTKKLLQLNQESGDEKVETTSDVSDAVAEQPSDKVTKDKDNLPDLAELDLPEDLGVEPGEGFKEVAQLPDTPEAKKFAEDFQTYLGISVEDFRQAAQDYTKTIEYFNQVKAEQYRKEAINTLSNEWGVGVTEVSSRLEQVQERFNKYPQEMRDRLDSLEGAKLIWAKIEQETSAKNNRDIPKLERSRGVTSTAPKVMFTQREIDNMSREEYERNADRIYRAYQLGLVK